MRSHLLALLCLALTLSSSYSKPSLRGFAVQPDQITGNGWNVQKDGKGQSTVVPPKPADQRPRNKQPTDQGENMAPSKDEQSTEPQKLKLGGFDIWDDRVAGNGWDIRKELIKGPNGFLWKPNEKRPTPPSFPPPLNELVWCPSCFLHRAYGSPTWPYNNPMKSWAQTMMKAPETPPILHLRGFDIWNNRVIGNGWDIQEKDIKGPDGFSWELNPRNPGPPSLPPPLNEIVWCPRCFLGKVYGRPTWSVDMSRFRRAPTLVDYPDEQPISHLRGFDIWKNRVFGNGWDILENFIIGPGGFFWEKSKATPTPPSLPPPLNEIVWCSGCFFEKTYGKPNWSVDMPMLRREPKLTEPPLTPYMAPQAPFLIPRMPPSAMSQIPSQGMPNSDPFNSNIKSEEDDNSPANEGTKRLTKEQTQPLRNEDTLSTSLPNLASGSTHKNVSPSARARNHWRDIASKALQANRESKNPTKYHQEVPTKGLSSNKVSDNVFPDTIDNSPEGKQDSSFNQNPEDYNIVDSMINFVNNLFSSTPSDIPKPTPIDFQNSMRDPESSEEISLKNKAPLEGEEVENNNSPVNIDLLPNVGQTDNNDPTSGDQTTPKKKPHKNHPEKEIGSGVEDKKQGNGNGIISEDTEDEDNTQTPENKGIMEKTPEGNDNLSENKGMKETSPEGKDNLPENEESNEENPETKDEQIPENKEHKPEVEDENNKLKTDSKETPKETPENNDDQASSSKEQNPEVQDEHNKLKTDNKETPEETPENNESEEQKPEVQDEEKDQGRHGIERPGVNFIKNTGTIKNEKTLIELNEMKVNLRETSGKVVIAKEFNNAINQPVREVYVNGKMVEKRVNKKKVAVQPGPKRKPKANCDDIKGKFEDSIDFTNKFHRIYNDDLYLLSQVTPDSVHLKTVYKETGDLYEEKYTLGPDGKLVFQKINGAITCGKP